MLRVTVENKETCCLVRCQGRICIGESLNRLRDAVLCQHTSNAVQVDLSQVSRVDAAGLGLMAYLFRFSCASGVEFSVVNATCQIREIFALVQLDFLIAPPTSDQVAQDSSRVLPSARFRGMTWNL